MAKGYCIVRADVSDAQAYAVYIEGRDRPQPSRATAFAPSTALASK